MTYINVLDKIYRGSWNEQSVINYCVKNQLSFNIFINQELLDLAEKYCNNELNFLYCHSVVKQFYQWLQSPRFLHESLRYFLEPAYSIILLFNGTPNQTISSRDDYLKMALTDILTEVEKTGSYPSFIHPIPDDILNRKEEESGVPISGLLSIFSPILGFILLCVLANIANWGWGGGFIIFEVAFVFCTAGIFLGFSSLFTSRCYHTICGILGIVINSSILAFFYLLDNGILTFHL